MKQLFLLAICLVTFFRSNAQCVASGTDIEYAWVNPEGTYLDLGSKRPLEGTHHKIFDLRTGKFVANGTNKYDFPLRGYGFVFETDTRFRVSDFTHWSADNTNITITKDGKYILKRTFTKHAHAYYDTVRGRGLIQEPTDKSYTKLYYLQEGSEPVLIDKKFAEGSMAPCRFSPDGRYAVGNDGSVVDMVERKVLTTKMAKKRIFFGEPVFSPDSRKVAFHAKYRNSTRDQYMLVFDLASQDLVSELHMPDSLNQMWRITILPLPDMERAALVLQRTNNHSYEPGTAYIMSEKGLAPLCNPNWKREKDEYEGKTTSLVYNEAANSAAGNCPMEVAAMEADGKWDITIGGSIGVMYLSARASSEVSGTYTYTSGTTKMKGKLSGKLIAKSEGGTCVHTITGTYDESLFGGAKGDLSVRLSADGKSISGNVGNAEWRGKKN